MTPRSLVLAALSGDPADGIPLTTPSGQVPRSQTERELRNAGLCLVGRGPPLLQPVYHKVEEERLFSGKAGAVFERIQVHTVDGDLSSVVRHDSERRASWTTERLFKNHRDYKPLMALYEDQRSESNLGAFELLQREAGEDLLLRPNLGPSPLHLIMHSLMGIDVFANEWNERQLEVLKLYKVIAENHRRRILQIAKSPALAVTYGGPLNAREIGADRFAKYYLPHLREFAEAMHTNGKLAGLQIQGDPRDLSPGIAATHVDYVEGFRDTGFRLEEAHRAWPDTTVWIDVPPGAHLLPEEGLSRWVRAIVKHSQGQRELLSTGTVPAERWSRNLLAIHQATTATESVVAEA